MSLDQPLKGTTGFLLESSVTILFPRQSFHLNSFKTFSKIVFMNNISLQAENRTRSYRVFFS